VKRIGIYVFLDAITNNSRVGHPYWIAIESKIKLKIYDLCISMFEYLAWDNKNKICVSKKGV